MNAVYEAIGTTKQNFHQRLNRHMAYKGLEMQLVKLMHEVRIDHPEMGAEIMYKKLNPQGIGRDRFEEIYRTNGFKMHQKRNYRRTTDSTGVIRFDNLLSGIELTGVNQAYSSDITYYEIGDRYYFLTFVLDVYSRRIKGYSVSKTMKTEDTTLPALQMAIRGLKGLQTEGLIFHSDGGGQYYSKAFTSLTGKAGMRNSMCKSVYENAHAERINGTIKNSYLRHYAPEDYTSLQEQTRRAVEMYNNERPHRSLGGLTPVEYEQRQTSNPQSQELLTKKKVAKKKNDNDNNHIPKPTLKTVNCI